jgi:GlpG protein
MRQIGTLSGEADARRFTAYLITQGIGAQAEEENDGWALWIREENQIEQARDELQSFKLDPKHSRYQGAERTAEAALREEHRRREKARKNIVELSGRWNQGGTRRAPLTMTLLVLSVVVTLWTNFGGNRPQFETLSFSRLTVPRNVDREEPQIYHAFSDIQRGQVWRLVTPIFMHLGLLHLVFNLFWLWHLGSQVENRYGTLYLGVLVLCAAIASNAAQAIFVHPAFGGMSGVVYALFGYVWMKMLFEPSSGMFISGLNVIIMVGWFFLAMTGRVGDIANVAHGVGLAFGIAVGYAPQVLGMWRR